MKTPDVVAACSLFLGKKYAENGQVSWRWNAREKYLRWIAFDLFFSYAKSLADQVAVT